LESKTGGRGRESGGVGFRRGSVGRYPEARSAAAPGTVRWVALAMPYVKLVATGSDVNE